MTKNSDGNGDDAVRGILRALAAREEKEDVNDLWERPPPALLDRVTLHEYQLHGLRWLRAKHAQGLSPILGDEMGLGKTLQVIAFLASLIEDAGAGDERLRFLVVAPLSVVPNWLEQFERFAPTIDVRMVAGQRDERRPVQAEIQSSDAATMVVVTTYEMLMSDTDFFANQCWSLQVLDEGHRLKNPRSRLHELLRTRLRAEHRVLLTGTPIQNDLRELFALLSLLNPTVFTDERGFEAAFKAVFSARAQSISIKPPTTTKPVGHNQSETLMTRVLSPVMLLRTVQDVNSAFTLPPMSEIVVHAPMSPMQREYYKEVVARNSAIINSIHSNQGSKISLINILPQLRKACNHPYLFPGAEPEPFEEGSHLYENSGKLYVLHQLLPRLRDQGHCVLLFSQSATFLDIIQDYLTFEGLSYERIDGSVRGKERWQAIERFRNSTDTFIFLITTRSGGVGLNLQRADTVIFVDSDYNPQADLQAVARAYRLGQTKPIHVIKLVTANTVEEIIYRRALKKVRMADRIRDCARDGAANGADEEDESKQSLVEMIQFGLHKLVEEERGADTLAQPLDESHIQHILTRKTMTDDATTIREGDNLEDVAGDLDGDNLYYFQGEDYSATEMRSRDEVMLAKLCQDSGEPKYSRKVRTRSRRYAGEEDDNEDAETNADLDDAAMDAAEFARAREERRQQRLERQRALWARNNYVSLALREDEAAGSVDAGDDVLFRRPRTVQFVSGDASRPRRAPRDMSPAIIVHCVDNSGVWCPRGFFRCLTELSPLIERQYVAAGLNGDLKLGQAHFLHLPDGTTTDPRDLYVCLLVVQGFRSTGNGSPRSKRQRVNVGGTMVRRGQSTTFRLHALEQALQTLARRAVALGASVHMPRIGYGTPQFNWYAVERIIRRQLGDQGADVSVYYFSRNRGP